LFSESNFKPGYLTYFTKTETSKVFLRDATEVPLFGLLLFGGVITINHWAGGIMLGKGGEVRLKAGTRIGVLCSQLRYVPLFIAFFSLARTEGENQGGMVDGADE